jgi:hypothetical protein
MTEQVVQLTSSQSNGHGGTNESHEKASYKSGRHAVEAPYLSRKLARIGTTQQIG